MTLLPDLAPIEVVGELMYIRTTSTINVHEMCLVLINGGVIEMQQVVIQSIIHFVACIQARGRHIRHIFLISGFLFFHVNNRIHKNGLSHFY